MALERPLRLPRDLRTIGVGGATLGGSGKSALALALASSAPEGLRVAVLCRAYPRRVARPLRVEPGHDSRCVGDEALMLSRALSQHSVEVWVGPREATLERLARDFDVAILDGVLQARPRRFDLSILSLEASEPWGAGHCPPAGDLWAPPERLVAACDLVAGRQVSSFSMPEASRWQGVARAASQSAFLWQQRLVGALTPEHERLGLAELGRRRLGLAVALGRPQRLLRELAAAGIQLDYQLVIADHERFPASLKGALPPLDAWITTPKCATKLENYYQGVPVWCVEQETRIPTELRAKCFARPSLR